ncbi:MAG: hypothetical protein R3F43_23310 [bacterium]
MAAAYDEFNSLFRPLTKRAHIVQFDADATDWTRPPAAPERLGRSARGQLLLRRRPARTARRITTRS